MATVTRERELLRELVALVRGECPSLLNEDSGGDVRLSMAIDDALAAPPAEDARDYVAELRECHELLTSCVGGVDPDEHPGLVARINVVLGGCDVAGVCPAPVDPVPGSVDYWREVAARLGAEVKLMADALKGTTEQRDDALAKLTTAQAPPASDPPGLDVQGIAAIAWKCIKECKGYDMPPVMCPAHQAEAKALARQSDPPGLLALVREYQALINGYGDGEQKLQELDDRLAVVQEQLLAYPLPASPQAETTKGDE